MAPGGALIDAMKANENKAQNGVPGVAVLLTWFLPGAGHLYLGKVGFALAAFVVVEGLYALGLGLSHGMFLEYLPPEMRGAMAGILTPEFGNLGALLYHMREYGYGPGFPRAWPPNMDAGTTLTAMSGVLNLILMSHAHLASRKGDRKDPAGVLGAPWAALATWAVPGLGQFLQGRRLRGLVTFVLLVSMFVVGTVLAEGTNLDRERHFYYWAGQFLIGLPAIVAEVIHGHARVVADVRYADAGVVLACVAGMLNVLSLLDAYGASEERQLGRTASTPAATQGGGDGADRPGRIGAKA